MNGPESLKNLGTGENIGKERTYYELKIAFFEDCLNKISPRAKGMIKWHKSGANRRKIKKRKR